MEENAMNFWYIYFPSSIIKDFTNVGSTDYLTRRTMEHNGGLVQSTKVYRPLKLMSYVAVRGERKARELEN